MPRPRCVHECFVTANSLPCDSLRRRPWKDDHYLERLRARQVFRNVPGTRSRLGKKRVMVVQQGLQPPPKEKVPERWGSQPLWMADGSADKRWIREPIVHFFCMGALGGSLRQPKKGWSESLWTSTAFCVWLYVPVVG